MSVCKHKILIADSHSIFRSCLAAVLKAEPDLEVIKEVGEGNLAVDAAMTLNPDLVLVDLSISNINGVEAIVKIRRKKPAIKVLVLTIHKQDEYIRAAFNAGANGYSVKNDEIGELFVAIRSVLSGKTYVSPTVSKKLIEGFLDGSKTELSNGSWDVLTQREREVMKLVAEGMISRQIAEYLSLSQKTVEKYRSNIMRKLELKNSSEVVAFAIEKGLVG